MGRRLDDRNRGGKEERHYDAYVEKVARLQDAISARGGGKALRLQGTAPHHAVVEEKKVQEKGETKRVKLGPA